MRERSVQLQMITQIHLLEDSRPPLRRSTVCYFIQALGSDRAPCSWSVHVCAVRMAIRGASSSAFRNLLMLVELAGGGNGHASAFGIRDSVIEDSELSSFRR
jgi:hypothetical protein